MKAYFKSLVLSFFIGAVSSSSFAQKPLDPKKTTDAKKEEVKKEVKKEIKKKVAKPQSFTIKGEILNVPEKATAIIQRMNIRNAQALDTILLKIDANKKGKFQIKGSLTEAGIYSLTIGENSIPLLLKGRDKLTIKADYTKFAEYVVTGSTLQATEAMRYKKILYSEVYDDNLVRGFVKQSAAEALSSWFVIRGLNPTEFYYDYLDVLEQLKKQYPSAVVTDEFTRYMADADNVINRRELRVGNSAKNLSFPNPDGKELSLRDLRGKVVLIDFWAAWCGPCRKNNPNLVKLYAKYKDKGFEIYSVSLDNDKAKWVKAIADDKLTWTWHVSDLKQWQSEAAKLYGVTGIPMTFLIDKHGKLAAVNYQEAQLEQAVEKLLE